MKLEEKAKKRRYSKKTEKRFYTQADMAIIKHDLAVNASKIKRKEDEKLINKVCPCGCGYEGCFAYR
mgnify:CR=1 FL=1